MTEPSELRDSIDTLCRNFMGTNMDSFALSLLKEQIEQLVEPLQAELERIHKILDGDESRIICDAKDGYPEGRTPRILTLEEEIVKALCKYAADWKRWSMEYESDLERLKREIEKLTKP